MIIVLFHNHVDTTNGLKHIKLSLSCQNSRGKTQSIGRPFYHFITGWTSLRQAAGLKGHFNPKLSFFFSSLQTDLHIYLHKLRLSSKIHGV